MKSLKLNFMLVAVLAGGLFLQGCKKEGCTDSTAINFDLDAKNDDGSCIYDSTETVTDNGDGTGTVTWTKDKTYILDGFVFVNSGQTLTIEAGTVIKGRPGTGASASALIVARGGRIVAEGTASEPIIFTAEQDDVNDPVDIPAGQRGLWGGLIVLGNATLNTVPGEQAIEGLPTSEVRGLYGGTDDADDSGILRYISLRYGGSNIGADNEINGVTFGGVGSGTVVEHIEVYNNLDDGFEWFGGTVNSKWLAAINCGDDAFDYDQGFRGNGQFWFALQDPTEGGDLGEHDGGTSPEDGSPFAKPVISNATYIGRGIGAGSDIMTIRDNAGGEYHNSIFVNQDDPIDIEVLEGPSDSYNQFTMGNIVFNDNFFYSIGVAGETTVENCFKANAGDTIVAASVVTAAQDDMRATFGASNTFNEDPGVTFNGTTANVIPTGAATSGASAPSAIWFDQVNYRGAFGTDNWLLGWSAAAEAGLF